MDSNVITWSHVLLYVHHVRDIGRGDLDIQQKLARPVSAQECSAILVYSYLWVLRGAAHKARATLCADKVILV